MLECIPDVLSRSDVKRVREFMDSSSFVDGKKTAGARARRVKHNQQIASDAPGREDIDKLVRNALRANKDIRNFALPKRIMRPMFSRYRPGDNYGLHVDDALMGGSTKTRTDVSLTLFISQADEYDGGELEISTGYGAEMIKLPAGSAVVYPSTTLHRVMPVSRGERLAAVTWIQSHVRHADDREILADLTRIRRRLAEFDPDGAEVDLAHKIRSNLLRRWGET